MVAGAGEGLLFQVMPVPASPCRRAYRGRVDNRAEIRDFLASRRARITPERAGLPAYGGNRRVKGLRREEVALLAGVSIDYYVRMERGNLAGASDQVLDGVANALQLDDAEREHLFALARAAGPATSRRTRQSPATVRPVIQQVLDAITDAPAWVRNARHDIIAMNPSPAPCTRRSCTPLPRARPAKRPPTPPGSSTSTRRPESSSSTSTAWPPTPPPCSASRPDVNPHDKDLITLVGELSTQTELFRQHWASQNVKFHRSGRKRLRHPAVGELDLNFEAMELPSEPALRLNIYTADPHTPTADGLKLLATWAATRAAESADTERTSDRI